MKLVELAIDVFASHRVTGSGDQDDVFAGSDCRQGDRRHATVDGNSTRFRDISVMSLIPQLIIVCITHVHYM